VVCGVGVGVSDCTALHLAVLLSTEGELYPRHYIEHTTAQIEAEEAAEAAAEAAVRKAKQKALIARSRMSVAAKRQADEKAKDNDDDDNIPKMVPNRTWVTMLQLLIGIHLII
jgi:hypothetical protein